eukprot:symbB.v1.2.002747.t1/scaffold146.1/size298692/28
MTMCCCFSDLRFTLFFQDEARWNCVFGYGKSCFLGDGMLGSCDAKKPSEQAVQRQQSRQCAVEVILIPAVMVAWADIEDTNDDMGPWSLAMHNDQGKTPAAEDSAEETSTSTSATEQGFDERGKPPAEEFAFVEPPKVPVPGLLEMNALPLPADVQLQVPVNSAQRGVRGVGYERRKRRERSSAGKEICQRIRMAFPLPTGMPELHYANTKLNSILDDCREECNNLAKDKGKSFLKQHRLMAYSRHEMLWCLRGGCPKCDKRNRVA